MKWTIGQWAALTWLLAVFIGVFGAPFVARGILENFWFLLVQLFLIASLLGIWLTAGIGPFWLRLLGMLVGQCLSFWGMAIVIEEIHVGITTGLAATTAFTSLSVLGLGCLGSLLPVQLTWNVRISLWEIVVSVGLIGVALAAIRFLSEIYQWNWMAWTSLAGFQYLVLAFFTGLLMTFVLLPLIVHGRGARWLAVILLLAAIALVPLIETATFQLFRLNGGDLFLFYTVHICQAGMALAIMIPLVTAFPGVLIRQTNPAGPPVDQVEPHADSSRLAEDFAEMQ